MGSRVQCFWEDGTHLYVNLGRLMEAMVRRWDWLIKIKTMADHHLIANQMDEIQI